MDNTAETIRANVDALLTKYGRSCEVTGGHRTEREHGTEKPWQCFAWRVNFVTPEGHGFRKVFAGFDYYTGLARVRPLKNWEHNIGIQARPVPPCAADVLYSLVLDSSAGGMSFDDWCAEYGADNDSIKDQRTYFECQDIAKRLRLVFTRAQIEELAEAVLEL